MPRPSHSRFYHPHNSEWGVQIMKLLIMEFSPIPCYLVPLRPKYSQHPILKPFLSTWHQFQCHSPLYLISPKLISYIPVHRQTHYMQLSYRSVSRATRYEQDGSGIESRWEREFSHLSRTPLELTHNVPG
jgi:hypothetical protein